MSREIKWCTKPTVFLPAVLNIRLSGILLPHQKKKKIVSLPIKWKAHMNSHFCFVEVLKKKPHPFDNYLSFKEWRSEDSTCLVDQS